MQGLNAQILFLVESSGDLNRLNSPGKSAAQAVVGIVEGESQFYQ